MRFIYKVLIGLVIFNGMVLALTSFFPYTLEAEHATDIVQDSNLDGYESLSPAIFSSIWGQAGAVALGIFVGSLAIAIISQQYALFIGIGAFISFITMIWSLTSSIVLKMGNYPIVNSILTIILICIGIISVLSIVEMLNAQRGAD